MTMPIPVKVAEACLMIAMKSKSFAARKKIVNDPQLGMAPYGIELEKLSSTHSGPLGRAKTILAQMVSSTGAGHEENFFKKKPKRQTGYVANQNAIRRVDSAEALAYLVCCLAADLIHPLQVG